MNLNSIKNFFTILKDFVRAGLESINWFYILFFLIIACIAILIAEFLKRME